MNSMYLMEKETEFEKEISEIALVKQHAIVVSAVQNMKHIALAGAPGSGKRGVENVICHRLPGVYEKVISLNAENLHDERLQVLPQTIHSIGTDEYGVPFSELKRIISEGKRFILFTSVDGVVALKKIFGNELMGAYFDATEHKRVERLHKKFNEQLTHASPEEKQLIKAKINDCIIFGNEEMSKYEKIVDEEQKRALVEKEIGKEITPFTFYCMTHDTKFSRYTAAAFVLDNAQLQY